GPCLTPRSCPSRRSGQRPSRSPSRSCSGGSSPRPSSRRWAGSSSSSRSQGGSETFAMNQDTDDDGGFAPKPPLTADHEKEAAPVDPALEARRRALGRMSIALAAVAGALMGIPIVGFIVAPLFRRAHRKWRRIGDVSQFKTGETVNVVLTDASPLP